MRHVGCLCLIYKADLLHSVIVSFQTNYQYLKVSLGYITGYFLSLQSEKSLINYSKIEEINNLYCLKYKDAHFSVFWGLFLTLF